MLELLKAGNQNNLEYQNSLFRWDQRKDTLTRLKQIKIDDF